MPPVRFVLLAFVCSTSLAYAGAVIFLVPEAPNNGSIYLPGEHVQIDVYAQLDVNSPASIRLRMAQFDLADTDPAFAIKPIPNHPISEIMTGPIPFWNFIGSPACVADEASCGVLPYFIDGDIAADDMLNITYIGLTSSGSLMIILRQSAPTLVGSLDVTLPSVPGVYLLDVLNTDESDVNRGAEIRFGFGTPTDPSIAWTARDGTVTGGRLVVIPEPVTLAMLLLGTACLPRRARRKVKVESRNEGRRR